MEEEKPTVSVVMPVYNKSRFVGGAIESILAQTFEDFELIIIDDGSTDGSTEILHRYAAEDDRIKLIMQRNRGISRTMNRGLSRARGKHFARMDADDISRPNRFEVQVGYLSSNPQYVGVGCEAIAIDAKGIRLEEKTGVLCSGNANRASIQYDHDSIVEGMLSGKWVAFFAAFMVRSSAIRKVSGYDEHYDVAEDLDLFLRLSEIGKLVNLPRVLYEYRHYDGQISNTSSAFRYLSNKVRRNAHLRRGKALPRDLQRSKMIRSYMGMILRKINIWPVNTTSS